MLHRNGPYRRGGPVATATRVFAGLAMGLILTHQASAAHFVRPFITFGVGQNTDGLILNGATQNTVQFNDAARTARSTVNLATGEMSLFASGNGPTVSSSGQGVMGDRLTFRNGAGTNARFTFGLDAVLDATVLADTPANSFLTWRLAIAVFDAGLVDHNNFFGNALQDDPTDIAPVFFQLIDQNMNNPAADITKFAIDEMITADVAINSNNESFDVFFTAGLVGISNNELGSYTLDGENTATAGLTLAPGVTVTSDSGVFLGMDSDPPPPDTPEVPEPASVAIWCVLGLGLMVAQRRRSRRFA